MIRRFIRRSLTAAVTVTAVLFVLNYLVRSDTAEGTSCGIVEHWVAGQPAEVAVPRLFHSESFVHWEEANALSERVASFISEHGAAVAADPRLAIDRAKVAELARRAYKHASAVPAAYLATSNAELPQKYQDYFARAMRLFAEGLEESDASIVREAMEQYNIFLRWIQARDRGDFQSLK